MVFLTFVCVALCCVGGDGDIILRKVRFNRGGVSWRWLNEWVVGINIRKWQFSGWVGIYGWQLSG